MCLGYNSCSLLWPPMTLAEWFIFPDICVTAWLQWWSSLVLIDYHTVLPSSCWPSDSLGCFWKASLSALHRKLLSLSLPLYSVFSPASLVAALNLFSSVPFPPLRHLSLSHCLCWLLIPLYVPSHLAYAAIYCSKPSARERFPMVCVSVCVCVVL